MCPRALRYDTAMTDKHDLPEHQDPPKPQRGNAEIHRERAAAKLRENLLRRKQQARARRAGAADETNGLPAAKKDESSE